jgi:hypothetical protein
MIDGIRLNNCALGGIRLQERPINMRNIITFTGIIAVSLLIGGISHADERIDLINEGKKPVTSPGSGYIRARPGIHGARFSFTNRDAATFGGGTR